MIHKRQNALFFGAITLFAVLTTIGLIFFFFPEFWVQVHINNAEEQASQSQRHQALEDSTNETQSAGSFKQLDESNSPARQDSGLKPSISHNILGEQSASEFLEAMALESAWTDSVMAANYSIWSSGCKAASEVSKVQVGGKLVPTSVVEQAKALATYCGAVSQEAEIIALDQLDAILAERPKSPKKSNLRDEIRDLPENEALQRVLEEIDRALLKLDEARVGALLGLIINQDLNLSTAGDNSLSAVLLWQVIGDVATTLLCERLDNCRGQNHPIVLRHCIVAFENGKICDNPVSIQDAIFQTNTPVSYSAYLQFLSAIRAGIADVKRSKPQEQ